MSNFSKLIRFEDENTGNIYLADIAVDSELPAAGSLVQAYGSIEDLRSRSSGAKVKVGKYLAPVINPAIPIYCAGLNYKTHAAEFKHPPLWTKPPTALANPFEDIPVNKYCAASKLDYEGELAFVTSAKCRDITPEQADKYILGFTVGHDLTCRLFQEPDQCASQAFYAKAFDKFAPIGPALISPELFANGEGVTIQTRVNGEVLQKADLGKDLIFSPQRILSHMSQGTTIPAGTVVMTGSPSGIGAFRDPPRFLKHDDVVEVEISRIGILKNRIIFE